MNNYKRTKLCSSAHSHTTKSPYSDIFGKYRCFIAIAGITLLLSGCSNDSSSLPPDEQNSTPALGAAESENGELLTSLASIQDSSTDSTGKPVALSATPVDSTPVDSTVVDTADLDVPAMESPFVQATAEEPPSVENTIPAASATEAPVAQTPLAESPNNAITTEQDTAGPELASETPLAQALPAPEIEIQVAEKIPQESIAEAIDTQVPVDQQSTETVLPRSFSSHTTANFSGQVQDDGNIAISWEKTAGAIKYNLYRDSEYLTTVSDNYYLDTETENIDSRYYEIESISESDERKRVARGLTVDLKKKVVELPTHITDGYDLVFEDNFDGNTLDSSKWNTAYLWGPGLTINDELQYYVDVNNEPDFPYNPFVLADGNLTIQSIRTPDHLLSRANNKAYLSGVITSYDAFKFTYGYAEARVQVPIGRGLWAAFWLLNAYYVDRKPEIDIMEHLGHKLDRLYHTYHYYDNEGVLRSTESVSSTGEDFTAAFHTFAVEWRPGTLIYYIDGVERHRVTDAEVSDQEMYFIANTAIGGWWPGSPDETTPFPASYKIDYIRAYQKRGPLDDPPQFDGVTTLPISADRTNPTPNHRPPFALWPQGYPDKQPE